MIEMISVRTGEVCALMWDKIALEKRLISIEHNVYSKIKDEKVSGFQVQLRQKME